MSNAHPTRLDIETIEHGWCSGCDWTVTGHRTRSNSWTHATRTGHRVRTAQTTIAEYAPSLTPTGGRDLTQPINQTPPKPARLRRSRGGPKL